MSAAAFPEEFADLEAFAGWAVATERERVARRIEASPAALRALYEALAPRMPAILAWLEGFDLAALPAPEQRLLWLTYAMAETAMAVEKFDGEGVVPLALDARRFEPLHETEGMFQPAGD